MEPKRVVVVGGTGNISGALVDCLVAAGHETTVFVRGQSRRKIPDGVRVITGDRADRAEFERAMQAESFDVAIDMIAYKLEDAESAARAFSGVDHLIHTSTVATFGGKLDSRSGR